MLEELQRLLAETELTPTEIASATGLSLSLIRAIRTGDRPNPTIDTYQALRACLIKAKRRLPAKAA